MCLLRVQVFVLDIKRFCPLVPIMMTRGHLKCSAVWHDSIDADGVPSTGERVPYGPFRFDNGQTKVRHDSVNNVQIFFDLARSIRFISVGSVSLKEMNFPNTNERTGLFGFVSEGVDHLIDFQREVFVRANPKWKHGVHGRFRRRSKEHRDVQFVVSSVLNPIHFFLESAVLLLVSEVIGVNTLFPCSLESSHQGVFLLEQILGNQQREVDFLVLCAFHFRMGECVDELHRLPTVRPPDIHPFDGVSFVDQFGSLHHEGVPFVEVLRLGRNASLRFSMAHGGAWS